jgi:hypothetical protein
MVLRQGNDDDIMMMMIVLAALMMVAAVMEEEKEMMTMMMTTMTMMIILLHYTVRCQLHISSKCLGTQQTIHSYDNNIIIHTGRVYSWKLNRNLKSRTQKLPRPKLGTKHETQGTKYESFKYM